MDKKEQDILNKIDQKTKNITVPQQLKPDAVKTLAAEKSPFAKKKAVSRKAAGALGLAAIFCVVIIGAWSIRSLKLSQTIGGSHDKMAAAKNHQQLYKYIDQYWKDANSINAKQMERKSDVTQEAQNSDAAEDTRTSGGYSETNVRQKGIDEADVVKTDGNYLYVMKDSRKEIAVVDPAGGEMEKSVQIQLEEGDIEEFYVNQDKLIVIYSISGTNGNVMPLAEDAADTGNSQGQEQTVTAVTYDISDPTVPKDIGKIKQSGSYTTSRMNGNYLYLFSAYFAGENVARADKKTYIPSVNGQVVAADSIYLPVMEEANAYTVITAVDINNPGETTDSKAVFSKGGELYVSGENIYLYEVSNYNPQKESTNICKVAYNNGKLEAVARCQVKGYLRNSFSIDEYEGYLRLVLTTGDANALYILDSQLNNISFIDNIAANEKVYSARFMGDMAYFVTYRETDPLFSADLSDPKKPRIVGTLKIPGFSEYLHPYGENQLLGIGMDVDAKTHTTSGVKLSMFDTTNKADVKEADTYVLDNVYSTDVSYSYKAAAIETNRNLIGFAGYTQGGQTYYLFSYEKGQGFVRLMETDISGSGMVSPRGIYIDNVIYIISGNVIESYRLDNYKKIGDIVL